MSVVVVKLSIDSWMTTHWSLRRLLGRNRQLLRKTGNSCASASNGQCDSMNLGNQEPKGDCQGHEPRNIRESLTIREQGIALLCLFWGKKNQCILVALH